MFLPCPKCWYELKTSPTECPNRGTAVDLYAREYARKLVAAIPRSSAERRAKICWVLGFRGKRSSVLALVQLLHDPDVRVRVAALRALGEIGDESAINAVEKATVSEHQAVSTVARQVLNMLLDVSSVATAHR
jgi:HEAT repeat protein